MIFELGLIAGLFYWRPSPDLNREPTESKSVAQPIELLGYYENGGW